MSPPPSDPRASDNGASATTPQWTTGWQRLSQTFLRPGTLPGRGGDPVDDVDLSRLSDDEKRQRISRVDPLERKVGLIGVVAAVALAIYANVPYMVSKIAVATTVKPKGKTCAAGLKYTVTAGKDTCNGVYPPSHYVFPLIVSLVLAAALYVTVRLRRRAPLAFVLVMNGLEFGVLTLIPFGVAGGWIMLRAWRTQKNGAPTARTPLPGWVPPPPKSRGRRPASGAQGSRSGRPSGKSATVSTSRKPPSANKRYTPKTPPKPVKTTRASAKKKVTPPA